MKVIGICGTNGSGKGTVVEILQKHLPVKYISIRKLIVELAQKEGKVLETRVDTKNYNDERHKNGKSIVSDFILMYDTEENKDAVFVLESIRRVSEVERMREHFGTKFLLISVDAPLEIRYERAVLRNTFTDKVSFEDFKKQEEAESVGGEEYEMNISKCIFLSDVKLTNDGDMVKFEKVVEDMVIKSTFLN